MEDKGVENGFGLKEQDGSSSCSQDLKQRPVKRRNQYKHLCCCIIDVPRRLVRRSTSYTCWLIENREAPVAFLFVTGKQQEGVTLQESSPRL